VVVISNVGKEVEVRLADGRTGVIAASEFAAEGLPLAEATVQAALLVRDDPRGRVVLSRAWARQQQSWERIEAAHRDREPLTGPVVKVIKGGVVMDVGVRAFLPASMIDEQPVADPSTLIGTDVTVLIVEFDRAKDRVVVSRRDHLRRVRRDVEKRAFDTLVVGARITGTVTAVEEYGLHLEVMGVRGLLHRSELSWARPPRTRDVAAVGDELEVTVVEVQRGKRRIGLSLRAAAQDPLRSIEPGQIHQCQITKMLDYGVVVRIAELGIDGLVHVTEMTELRGMRPDEIVTPGELVSAKVLSIDTGRRRVALSTRQAVAG